jgi:hypothetical protein
VVIKNDPDEKSQLLSEAERVQLKKSLFERVAVENRVEFWSRQANVREKIARKELDCDKKISCVLQ